MLRLGGIAKVTAGQAAPKKFGNDGYPFIRAGHLEELIAGKSLSDLPKVTEEISKKHKLNLLPKDSIVFAKSGMSATKNRIYILKEEAYFVSHLAAILPNDNIDMSYLAKFLFWYNPTNLVLDEAYPSIRLEDINNLKIPLPPLPQQQKIANILDAADALRQNDKALIAKYDELTQALFLDMFGDPVSNPKGWEFSTIEKILISKSQNGHYATKEEYIESGVEMVHMSDAFYQKVIPGNLKTVKYNDKLLSKYILKSTDLLISRRSLTYEGAAKPCFIPQYERPLIYESSLIKLSPNLELINNVFLFYFLSNQRARSKYILIHVTKSTISGINNKGLNSIQVILPPIDLQNQYAERVAIIEEQKAIAQKRLEKSEELFNSLLQKAFKGELI